MRVLLLTPPMTQLNTPYPATAYLTGFLRGRGFQVTQADPGLTWTLRLLSPAGIGAIAAELGRLPEAARRQPAIAHVLAHAGAIAAQIEPVVRFLQGKDPALAHLVVGRRFLAQGPRLVGIGPSGHQAEYLDWAFGTMGLADRAKHFATLYLEDLADAIQQGIDPHFDFSRYAEALALSPPSIDPLLEELGNDARLTACLLDGVTAELAALHAPDVIGMSLPFPGNVLGGLRMAKTFRRVLPNARIVWGGGWVNTELRELDEPRLFDWIDAVTYDDGEQPLLMLLKHWAGGPPRLLRTRVREAGAVRYLSTSEVRDLPLGDIGTPTYAGLPLADYLSLVEVLNPMHRLWSDTRWNKLTVAHGCYWKKCAFCDLGLDYIGRYDPMAARVLVDRIEALIAETGTRGFHFVDEAAPPAGLKAMAEELLRRGVTIAWWGNVRFEKTFTPELCALLARSGCIAVSGGLEAAANRLLELMAKGVTVEQVARVTKAFADTGILVHAYLMYGFPTQTAQETVDSLELVRQLFVAGCIDSAYWHRFSATAHSPIGKDPARYGIELCPAPRASFARNDLAFVDRTGCDHGAFSEGLKKAVYNFMHGMGLEDDVRAWFGHDVPRASVRPDFIGRAL